MRITVAGGKREIGLGPCLVLIVGSGIVSHYAFRQFGLPHSLDVFGFSLSLVALVATVIGLGGIYLLAKPPAK